MRVFTFSYPPKQNKDKSWNMDSGNREKGCGGKKVYSDALISFIDFNSTFISVGRQKTPWP